MFVNLNKMINPLATLVKKKRKIQINNIRSKNWDINCTYSEVKK